MLKYLDELDIYKQYWFVTITPYGKDIELAVPNKEKVKRNAPDLRPPTKKEQITISKAFARIGKENDIVIHSCCEKDFLSEYGLKANGCMSQEILEKAIGCKLEPTKRKNLRQECNCLMGNDIGAYNTCGHLCKYCYANANKNLVIENMKKHNENSPFLIGSSEVGDEITEAKQKSWIVCGNEQISFFKKVLTDCNYRHI